MSRPTDPELVAIIQAAEERAHRDVVAGMVELRRLVAAAPEWKLSNKTDGSRIVVPERAILSGLLAQLERSVTSS